MMSASTYNFWDLTAAEAEVQAEMARYSLPPQEAGHPSMIEVDVHGFVNVYWGGYEYSIPLAEMKTPGDVLWKIHHLSKKGWEHMTPYRIGKFVAVVARCNEWAPYAPIHGPMAPATNPTSRTTTNATERAKLTPKLRYDVLRRDNFQCRACGASPETGAHLHIDHIEAIANGGKTTFTNLQALCSPCNYGKGVSK